MNLYSKEIENIRNSQWYEALVDECKAIITEAVFTSRWALVEGHWELGKRIREEYATRKELYGKKIAQGLAESIGVSERTINYACAAYDKYPELSKIPEGKNITWNKLITKYLPALKEEKLLPLPEGKYNVIYADPPWEYDVDLATTRSPENNYPVMDLKKIKKFGRKVKKASNKDCILFMWITAPKLNWMNEVLEAWGFEYKTNYIWDKVKHNMGHYSSVRHEILIIAGKGKCAPTCDGTTIQSIDSVQSIEKSPIHSEKPMEFYEIIQKLYPDGKGLELFNRSGAYTDYWTVWGNESI